MIVITRIIIMHVLVLCWLVVAASVIVIFTSIMTIITILISLSLYKFYACYVINVFNIISSFQKMNEMCSKIYSIRAAVSLSCTVKYNPLVGSLLNLL
jgi:hypothetical protein